MEYNNVQIKLMMYYQGRCEMEYITAQEAADKWGISRRRVQVLCADGRIEGAIKMANLWLIPEEAEKPDDARKHKIGGSNGKE